jgi:hypothetical protein
MTLKINFKKWRILYPLFFAFLISVFAWQRWLRTDAAEIRVKPYRLNAGWGYQVLVQKEVLINQPFIPAIPGQKAFPTRELARKTGRVVKEKLLQNKLPSVTLSDLMALGIDSLGRTFAPKP